MSGVHFLFHATPVSQAESTQGQMKTGVSLGLVHFHLPSFLFCDNDRARHNPPFFPVSEFS